MPSTPWPTARAEIAREFGLVEFAADRHGDHTVDSEDLQAIGQGAEFWNSWYLLVEDRSYRVSAYAESNGRLTVAGPNLPAFTDGTELGLYRVWPRLIDKHFPRAAADLYPQVCELLDYRALVADPYHTEYRLPDDMMHEPYRVQVGRRPSAEALVLNILDNPSFEDWEGDVPDDWTYSTPAEISQEEYSHTANEPNYYVLTAGSSAKVEPATGNGNRYLLQRLSGDHPALSFSIWVYCQRAGNVTAAIGNQANVNTPVFTALASAAHSGTGWERLIVHSEGRSDAVNVVGLIFARDTSAYVAFVDEAIAVSGPEEPFEPGWVDIRNWTYTGPTEANAAGTIHLMDPTWRGQLRIIGAGQVKIKDDAIPVAGAVLQTLYDKTRALVARELAQLSPSNPSTSGQRISWRNQASTYTARVERHLRMGRYTRRPRKLLRTNY